MKPIKILEVRRYSASKLNEPVPGNNITVRETNTGSFEIADGHLRIAAIYQLGEKTFPVTVHGLSGEKYKAELIVE